MLIQLSSRIALPLHILMTLLFIGGIIIQEVFEAPLTFIVFATFASASGIFLYIKKKTMKKKHWIFLCAIALCIGASKTAYKKSYHEALYAQLADTKYDCVGTISSIEHIEHSKKLLSINITLLINTKTQEHKNIQINVLLYTHRLNHAKIGDSILMQNIIFKRPSNKSFQIFLLKEGVLTILFDYQIKCLLLKRPSFCPSRFLHEWKRALYDQIKNKMNPSAFSLFCSLFLGKKNTNTIRINSLKNCFKKIGISHYLARSGLHMIIFILLWINLLKCFPLSLPLKNSLLVSCSIIYFLFSWQSISFLRALITFLLAKLCTFTYQQISSLSLLFITGACILLYNPYQLFFMDFQLSFFLSLALIMYQLIKRSRLARFC